MVVLFLFCALPLTLIVSPERIGSGRIESYDISSRHERAEEPVVPPSVKLVKPSLLSSLVADKQLIKASMVKVVRETTTTSSPVSKVFQ